jgi:rSAM/selenodomain-associated transferase 2
MLGLRASVTIVIPVYRDTEALARTLAAADLSGAEVIVAATTEDQTLAPLRLANPDVIWLEAPRGRARQMNAGAAAARGEWLLFLHADSRLPAAWREAIDEADRRDAFVAGCYRFALDSISPFARLIELGVRLRVALFALPYGDQGLFVRRERFEAVGGFTDLPIMEDVDFVRRMHREGALFRSPLPVVTSARRWERDGWVSRTLRHLLLIVLYYSGVPPARLVRLDRARQNHHHPEAPPRRMSL